jgi:hypothetical protein
MFQRKCGLYLLLALAAIGPVACSSPVSPAGAVSVTVAAPATPANGAQIPNLSQPVTLTATNATTTDATATVTYTFEVATDAGFSNKVQTKDVAQSPGQTSVKLDTLPAGADYYWHVRAKANDTVGTFTSPIKFTIGAAIVVGTPTPTSPGNGAVLGAWPTLTVSDAPHSGPVGQMVYRFDVSTAANFSSILLSGTINETPSQTSFSTSSQSLPNQNTQYFWRVTATDQGSGITGVTSPALTFTISAAQTTRQAKLAAQLGVALWPGVQPPGTNGHAVMGDNWDVQQLVAFGGTRFTSPMLEWLQLFDLIDRGFDPQGAIDWMHANGYSTNAAWFAPVQVIGVQFMYLALINGQWDLVLRGE